MKIGLLATYPARRSCLHEMLLTVFQNLDRLYLYCNEYQPVDMMELAHWVSNHKGSCEVILIDPQATNGNIQDMGKFWALDFIEGYVFLLDDDLRYPEDYFDKHIQAIHTHESISTIHGRVINQFPMNNYFGNTTSFNYQKRLNQYQMVNIAGTGTVAFHTAHINGPLFASAEEMQRFKGMADIWFATRVLNKQISIYCLPRPAGWLIDTENQGGESLYNRFKEDTSEQVNILNNYHWPRFTVH